MYYYVIQITIILGKFKYQTNIIILVYSKSF